MREHVIGIARFALDKIRKCEVVDYDYQWSSKTTLVNNIINITKNK